jgi:hypothetical protein
LTIGIAPHDDVLANLLRDQKSMIKIDPSIELGGIIGYVENQGVTLMNPLISNSNERPNGSMNIRGFSLKNRVV